MDIGSMTAGEMLARRSAAEKEISGLIGRFVFSYSRFVTGLHICVAWHNDGKDITTYPSVAEDLAVADLLKKIEKQGLAKFGRGSTAFKKYKSWLRSAHHLREARNIIMHSRWGIEPYGRHATAISTIFVEPVREVVFTSDQLQQLCGACDDLMAELNQLREVHPL